MENVKLNSMEKMEWNGLGVFHGIPWNADNARRTQDGRAVPVDLHCVHLTASASRHTKQLKYRMRGNPNGHQCRPISTMVFMVTLYKVDFINVECISFSICVDYYLIRCVHLFTLLYLTIKGVFYSFYHGFAMLFVSVWHIKNLYPQKSTPTWRCANGEALLERSKN